MLADDVRKFEPGSYGDFSANSIPDLDQDQAAPAVSQWNTVGLPLDPDADSNHPMDFGISPKPPTAYRARTLRNWATPAGARKDNLGGVRAFPQEQAATSPRGQEPKSPRTNTGGSSKCQPPLRPSQDPELGPPGALGWDKKFVDFKYALMPNQVDISDISGFWVNKSRIEGTYLSDRTSFVYETDKE